MKVPLATSVAGPFVDRFGRSVSPSAGYISSALLATELCIVIVVPISTKLVNGSLTPLVLSALVVNTTAASGEICAAVSWLLPAAATVWVFVMYL